MAISSKWLGMDLTDDQLTSSTGAGVRRKGNSPGCGQVGQVKEARLALIKKAAECGIYSPDFYTTAVQRPQRSDDWHWQSGDLPGRPRHRAGALRHGLPA